MPIWFVMKGKASEILAALNYVSLSILQGKETGEFFLLQPFSSKFNLQQNSKY